MAKISMIVLVVTKIMDQTTIQRRADGNARPYFNPARGGSASEAAPTYMIQGITKRS
jgi:hypothetical protein